MSKVSGRVPDGTGLGAPPAIPRAGIPHEARLKMASELTIQRRIQEHARDRAKRELAFAQEQLERIDADFMRYVVEGFKADIAAVAKPDAQPPATGDS